MRFCTLTHPSGISVIDMVIHIKSMETKCVCGCLVQIVWLLFAEALIQMQASLCRNCNTNAGSIVDRLVDIVDKTDL